MLATELPDGAGAATPEKDEATGQGGFRGAEKDVKRNCADGLDFAQLARQKRLASVRARLALKNYSLREMACGALLISRLDRSAHCNDFDGMALFLRRSGGGAR